MKPTEDDRPDLLRFPCAFPIKVMGKTHDQFAQVVAEIVTRHAPDFDPATIEMRVSGKGNYLSLTCTIVAMSRAQLDALYLELSRHSMVKVVL